MMTLSDTLANPLYFILAIAVIILLWFIFILRNRRFPYVACDTLLTQSELRFYHTLKQAIPSNTAVMMKVRMADLINCDETAWQAGWGPRISAKHIDFVLIDPITTKIKLAIELDDSTHRTNQDRIDRDKFVNKAFEVAKVKLLRIETRKNYNRNDLEKMINQSIATDQRQI